MILAGTAAFGRSSACVLRDGALPAIACEEWFSQRKDDPAIPEQALAWCCTAAGARLQDLDWLVFAEKPVQRFIRILGHLARGFPCTLPDFVRALPIWLGDRLWLKTTLAARLRLPPERLLFVERPVAQAATALFSSPCRSAAILVVDATSEWATTTLAEARTDGGRTRLSMLAEVQYPHALWFVQEALLHHLQLPEAGGVRWLAALGAHGDERLRQQLEVLVPHLADGAHALDLRHFRLRHGRARFSRRGHAIVGAPPDRRHGLLDGSNAPRPADLVRSAQRLLVDRILAAAEALRRRTNARQLCLGGAVLQDPWLAGEVLARAPFDEVHLAPLQDEAGCAHGAAAYVAHVVLGQPRGDFALLAPPPPPLPAAAAGEVELRHAGRATRVAAAAAALAAGEVIAWVESAPEPTLRPIGRSVLLADPCAAAAIARLQRVKLSEPFVPPMLLADQGFCSLWTDARRRAAALGGLASVTVPDALRARLGNVVAPDGTVLLAAARGPLAELLHAVAARNGGPPLLAMSSYNRAGEPPVVHAAQAIDLLRRSGATLLCWGDTLVSSASRLAAAGT